MRMTLLLFCALAVSDLRGEDIDPYIEYEPARPTVSARPPASEGTTLWKISLVSVAAANALDIHSSWGKRELNHTLATSRGSFGAQSAAIKLALQGGMVGVQYLFLRGKPNRTLSRVMAIMNFGAATTMTVTAAHNYGIPRPPR